MRQGRERALLFAFALLLGAYYSWSVRSAGHEFDWRNDRATGYYNLLGRAFAAGHTYLEIKPKPELLAHSNPWDPTLPDDWKLADAVLFNRRYYLYHGAAPAALLFAPWRKLTGRDLPENFAVFVLVWGGWLFSATALLGLLRIADLRPGLPLLGVLLAAIGVCQSIPFLMSRVWVYEVAIAGGYFFVAAGLYFLVRAWESASVRSPMRQMAAAGLLFGIAIGCRPHLGLMGTAALALCAWNFGKRALALALPFAAAGLAVCAYNQTRFGNPLDFGMHYLLSAPGQTSIHPDWANVGSGLFYYLACAPAFSPVFPWIRSVVRVPEGGLPPHYMLEPLVGALWLAPFAVFAPGIAVAGRARPILAGVALHVLAVFLFLVSTGWSVPRYMVDFLPLLVLLACIGFVALASRMSRPIRSAVTAAFCACVLFGTVANMALGFAGPFDEMLTDKPRRYTRIARWFSPVDRYRPVLSRAFQIRISRRRPPIGKEPETLLRAGVPSRPYELAWQSGATGIQLTSRWNGSTETSEFAAAELPTKDGQVPLDAAYDPGIGEIQVRSGGTTVLRHRTGPMVSTAPEILTVP